MKTTTRKNNAYWHSEEAVLCLFLLFYGACLCYLKITALHHGLANADLTLYQNILWNTNLNGLFFYSDFLFYEFGYQSYLTEHFASTLALLVPLYKAWSSPYMLLLLQGVTPVFTALLFFIYSQKINLPKTIAILTIISYCVHPTVVMATLDIGNGFHHDTLIPPLLLASLILFKSPRYLMYYFMLILTLGLKENVPFIVLIASIIAFITTNDRKRAVVTGGLAIAFIVFALVIIPDIYNVKPQHASDIIERAISQKTSFSAMLCSLWANKELFWFISAFLSPLLLLTIVPELAIYHFSSYETYIFDWHGLPSVTIVVIASMLGFTQWKKITTGLNSSAATRLYTWHLIAIVLLGSFYSLAKSRNLIFETTLSETSNSRVNIAYFREVEYMLPEQAKLGSQYAYWPYAANRKHLLLSEHSYHAEYLFIDTELLHIENDMSLIQLVINLLKDSKITTLAHHDSRFFLFRVDAQFNHQQPKNFLKPLDQKQFSEAKKIIATEGLNLYLLRIAKE
ncbi:DUF2079 domain-containing protein [Planctobacterium marinum]|uniref:DUF2079 domain-containing protein n=1 Tax=Planctobacterium marinum TaxID=1631968 RepID=UPI001E63540A|nr:DUF2079 domain-containing protein [Planctobacterium marinum]MCC2607371.1 DUF2079 domain-containing protein [Planctobacterium marinum]